MPRGGRRPGVLRIRPSPRLKSSIGPRPSGAPRAPAFKARPNGPPTLTPTPANSGNPGVLLARIIAIAVRQGGGPLSNADQPRAGQRQPGGRKKREWSGAKITIVTGVG